MKVYRGYNKEVGPISYPNWIYVTADPEQAKYYATKDGFVKDGAIIEYDMDKDNMHWISLRKINSFAESDSEYYSEEDLLWYQEELAESLKGRVDGIIFKDPYNENHTIYIVLDESLLLNGRVLSKEEFDSIQLKESAYENELNDALASAGIQLNEKVVTVNPEIANTQLVTSPYELNEIIENHPEKRIIYDMENRWFLVGNSETSIHVHLVNDALQGGVYEPFEYNGEMIDGSQEDDGDTYCDLHSDELVLFVTSANTDKNLNYLEDNYYYTYVYKDYVVYDRKYDFRFTPLYKILGEPLSVTYWDGFNKKNMLLNEKVIPVNRELADTKLVTSAHELNEIIKHNTESRIVYDKEKNWFLIGNGENSIHIELINDALKDGIYSPFEWNGHIIDGNGGDGSDDDGGIFYQINPKRFVLFRTSSDSLNGEDYYYDRYQYCYIYKDYCVFTRDTDFEETPLYKLLGEPLDIENNGNVLEDEGLNESVNKGIDFVAYHGGVEPDMIPAKDRPLYLTDSFELAHKFAKREIWNDGLYEGEIPTVFTFKGHFNNPYYMTLDEYNDEGQDSNIDIQKWLDKGIDGIIIPPNEEGSTTYYIVIDLSTIKLIDKKVFDDEALPEDLDEQINDILKLSGTQLNEREDLSKFNRIAGFYHLKTKQFELFPRTSEEISPEDDEVNDYIHNVHSKDEFTEFNIVRFGIEDIKGEGVVCYIEADTKKHAEECYYAILEKYAEDCEIIKYELEYYVGNTHKYIFLDRYGNQIMESLNEELIYSDKIEKLNESKLWINDKILYHGTNRNFDTFKVSKKGTFGKGIYLSPNYNTAQKFGNKLLKVKVNLKNPIYLSHETDDKIKKLIMYNKIDELQKMGYDGIIVGDEEYCSEVVVWNPKDVKIIKNLDESVEELDIFKNPTFKELKKYDVDRWRLLQDTNGNYYFADAWKYTHDVMSNKLRSIGIDAVDANTDNCGITLYNALTNTFYYRLLGIIDYEDVVNEYKTSYLSKEFPNADLSQSNDDDNEEEY